MAMLCCTIPHEVLLLPLTQCWFHGTAIVRNVQLRSCLSVNAQWILLAQTILGGYSVDAVCMMQPSDNDIKVQQWLLQWLHKVPYHLQPCLSKTLICIQLGRVDLDFLQAKKRGFNRGGAAAAAAATSGGQFGGDVGSATAAAASSAFGGSSAAAAASSSGRKLLAESE